MTQSETSVMGGRASFMLDHAPSPIWLEDWSGVATFCDEMRAAAVTDLRATLEADEGLLRSVIGKVVVREANARALAFVGASDRSAMLGRVLARGLSDDALRWMLDQIVVVWEGGTEFERDINGRVLGGPDTDSKIQWAVPCVDGVADYSSAIIMVHDTTAHMVAAREMELLIEDVGVHMEASRQIEEHAHRLEALIDMSRSLASSFDLDVLLQLVVTIIRKVVGADQAIVHLFDLDKEEVTAVVGRGLAGSVLEGWSYAEAMDGLCGWLADTNQAAIVSDLGDDDRIGEIAAQRSAVFRPGASAAAAPVILDEKVVGSVIAISSTGRSYLDVDLSLLRMIAAQTGVGLHNAELYGELRRSRDEAHAAHHELEETQTQLLQSQKLEAIGSLAAGIAHEINTPIQFVSDNASFIQESMDPLAEAFRSCSAFVEMAAGYPDLADEAAEIKALWESSNCAFLIEEIPDAAAETLEGARRVAEIVRAMKDFAHPGWDSKSSVDINHVIKTTAQISRNEWKYVAEMELDLDDTIPQVPALAGPLGQSLLILFVNSAQALRDQGRGEASGMGKIRVATSLRGDFVEIRVADDGPGIPPAIVDRIFDPFFTTKDVGKGSGQGLSIARSVVVDKHGGEIQVEQGDPGAVFVIRLPLRDSSGSVEPFTDA